LLPILPDFTEIEFLKDEVCQSLEACEERIQTIKMDMSALCESIESTSKVVHYTLQHLIALRFSSSGVGQHEGQVLQHELQPPEVRVLLGPAVVQPSEQAASADVLPVPLLSRIPCQVSAAASQVPFAVRTFSTQRW